MVLPLAWKLNWKLQINTFPMNKRFLFLMVFFNTVTAFAQIPSGYYNDAQGLSGEQLRIALHNIIKNHTVISYNGLWNAYRYTDKKPNGKVWDMYSNCDFTFSSDQCGSYTDICDCYNREHSVPQSWFGEASPMVSDIFHVVPTDGKVNGYRSNHPFGECANGTVYGLGKLGTSTTPGYTSTVFEPSNEYKGDFARIYFYMATRYMNVLQNWGGASFSGNNLSVWTQNMMVAWHISDPVSQKEIDRNNVIYSNYQHNRNPFVDHPEWVFEIWGNGNAVLDPQNYTAYAFSSDQINVVWNLNAAQNDILLAFNTVNSFGTPQPDNTIAGAGNVLATGQLTSFEHTGLAYQTYYYKIWSSNADGEFSNGIVVSATPYKAEPQNHATSFRVTNSNSYMVSLAWSDATGNPLPDKYLILASEGTVTPPVDGTAIYDGALAKNVNYGIQNVTFNGLEANKTYHFSVFPYTNYGAAIDYKITGAPTATASTGGATEANLVITEIAGRGYNGNFNDEYIEISNLGGVSASLSGYTLEYYESSLEATLNLTGTVAPNSGYVVAVRTTHSSSISPNFVPTSSFSINNPCYVALKQNDTVIDQAGSSSDKFDAKDKNFEFTNCGGNNSPTSAWTNLGSSNGTPGVVNCLSGIDEEFETEVEGLVIYPNPVTSTLTLESTTELPAFTIYNIFGQALASYEFATTQVDVSALPSGIYFIRFSNGLEGVRFVKQ